MGNISISNLPYIDGNADEILDFTTENIGIELFIEPLVDKYERNIEKLLCKLNTKDLSLHCPYKLVNEAAPKDSDLWEKTLNAFKYTVNLCTKYNCKYMVVHTNEHVNDRTEAEKFARENLNTIINLISRSNIIPAIENVGIGFDSIFTIDKYIELFNEYDNIKAVIDVGHAFANSWDMEKLIHSLKDKIISYHLHDNYGTSDLHLPIGEGKLNWNEFFKLYNKYTPKAKLVLEYKIGTKRDIINKGIKCVEKFL